MQEHGPFISCENVACKAWFVLVPARRTPWLCLDHAEDAKRVGLLCMTAAGTSWYPPEGS